MPTPTAPKSIPNRRPALTRKRVRGLIELRNGLALFTQGIAKTSDKGAALKFIDQLEKHFTRLGLDLSPPKRKDSHG